MPDNWGWPTREELEPQRAARAVKGLVCAPLGGGRPWVVIKFRLTDGSLHAVHLMAERAVWLRDRLSTSLAEEGARTGRRLGPPKRGSLAHAEMVASEPTIIEDDLKPRHDGRYRKAVDIAYTPFDRSFFLIFKVGSIDFRLFDTPNELCARLCSRLSPP